MAMDSKCRYLATGDVDGTVKIWDIRDYCTEKQDDIIVQPPSKSIFLFCRVENSIKF